MSWSQPKVCPERNSACKSEWRKQAQHLAGLGAINSSESLACTGREPRMVSVPGRVLYRTY